MMTVAWLGVLIFYVNTRNDVRDAEVEEIVVEKVKDENLEKELLSVDTKVLEPVEEYVPKTNVKINEEDTAVSTSDFQAEESGELQSASEQNEIEEPSSTETATASSSSSTLNEPKSSNQRSQESYNEESAGNTVSSNSNRTSSPDTRKTQIASVNSTRTQEQVQAEEQSESKPEVKLESTPEPKPEPKPEPTPPPVLKVPALFLNGKKVAEFNNNVARVGGMSLSGSLQVSDESGNKLNVVLDTPILVDGQGIRIDNGLDYSSMLTGLQGQVVLRTTPSGTEIYSIYY